MFTKDDWQEIDKLINYGYISKRKHPTHDLWILNYTQKTQIEWFWNEYTECCRGLIVDKDNNIISRPFRKFFNYEQLEQANIKPPNLPFEVFEKMDGCLGISYFINHTPYIASRGSFYSDPAIVANKILNKYYKNVNWNENYTYLFEIISPETRIIIDYGNKEKLVLLAIIDTKTGNEIPLSEAPKGADVVKRYDGIYDYKTITKIFSGDNKEGFVIRFLNGFRIKIKFDKYKELHFYASKLTKKSIWEMLSEGKSNEEILKDVPDEFINWCKNVIDNLLSHFYKIEDVCSDIIRNIRNENDFLSKKDIAAIILKEKKQYQSILFKMDNNQSTDKLIWKLIKPKGKTDYFGNFNEEN